MNLLVTNTRNAQAYSIIRALRPYAQKIVVTINGKNRLVARLSHASNSRLVDKRYYVPFSAEDWRAGNIGRENTKREETYIQAVLRICEVEKIDIIFPSNDPQVYVFSKNKERFERIGVLIPIPDYEIVITPLDKYRTIQVAQEVGFPCPKTYLPESEDDLRRISGEVGFPLVLKLRFTAGGWGLEIVKNFSELLEKTLLIRKNHGMPLVQEYIPGGQKQKFYLMLDKKGELKVGFCTETLRNFNRLRSNLSTAARCTDSNPYLVDATRLVQKLGWWGGATIEMKVDPRDGIPRLMEINPRLGVTLWLRTEVGINEPLMCLKIGNKEEIEEVKEYPAETIFLHPVEDMLGLGFKLLDLLVYKFCIGVQRKAPIDPFNAPMSIKELIQSYKQTYFGGRKKVLNPYFTYFFQDPLVSINWWLQFFWSVKGAVSQLGR